MNLLFRHELENEYRVVEEMIKRAFWNMYTPGCNEHFLANRIRVHKDYLQDVSFVATFDNKIVGQIMYTKSHIVDENNNVNEVITFGPVCVEPEYQGQGIGEKLIQYSIDKAKELGFKGIIIFGDSNYYSKFGFGYCKEYDIYADIIDGEKVYPKGMLVLPLYENAFDSIDGKMIFSEVFDVDNEEAEEFDKDFFQLEKGTPKIDISEHN